MDNSFEQVIKQLPDWFQEIAAEVPPDLRGDITELRLFLNQSPVWMENRVCRIFRREPLNQHHLDEIFYAVCRGSVHSVQREICEGYVTMDGGHRVGLCGTAVFYNGQQTGLRDITSLNIRFASQKKGCADQLFYRMKGLKLEQGSFLLAGEPGSGKTTLLRDYARILADSGVIVALLDERGELSGFDLGQTAHVLKHLPKERAILQAVRTLAPQVIICDEIGSEQEAGQLCEGLNSGCHFIASIHGNDLTKLLRKPQLRPLLQQKALDAVVQLKPLGQIQTILRMEEAYADDGLRTNFSLRIAGRDPLSEEAGGFCERLARSAAVFPADPRGAANQPASQRRDPAECLETV